MGLFIRRRFKRKSEESYMLIPYVEINWTLVIQVVFFIALLAGSIWYCSWQYGLCRAEGLGKWYCIQHAWG